jgi:hypothetical protein
LVVAYWLDVLISSKTWIKSSIISIKRVGIVYYMVATYIAWEETSPCGGIILNEAPEPVLIFLLCDDNDVVLLEGEIIWLTMSNSRRVRHVESTYIYIDDHDVQAGCVLSKY